MQKRRSHKKSRNGCQNCKKWHTKCDEQGPPCNNCALRKAKCVYSRPNDGNVGDRGSLSIRTKRVEAAACRIHVDRPPGDIGALCGAYGGPSRLLDLELMHQWSTKTFECFKGIPEDGEYLQNILPRSALKYDFMLNCIMAISSLHIAKSVEESQSAKYLNAALEFYNRGSSSFRTNLGSINEENCLPLYMFSAIAVTVHLSIPQSSPSILSHATVAFDLLIGCTSIGMMAMPWLLESPFPLRIFLSRMGASKDLIDADAKAAFARLRLLNDRRYKATSQVNYDQEETPGVVIIREHELYEMTIQFLELCYAEEARGVLSGFCTTFPSMAGKPFVSLFSQRDPFTLLIVMHWAVLLNEVNEKYWYMTSFGWKLAVEIADLLKTSHPELALEWEDAISWPLKRMGLPVSQPRQLSYSEGGSWELVRGTLT
ncbi:hypothetical protein F4820DRAFT_435466 [Hypoxylon rubiginosum]|uniref:Uncharacterized protein n=1 Tax=Hypoxylon rubiginosum TaxID=110542 RepID=A0ACB9YNI4_9PEZI|nr:hypothetical protein F4820DRAFT_435466 [Hypoxylon rubiginosum]